jgi:hypothetical protein
VVDYLRRAQLDWPSIHHELKRPGVTLLLWQKYRTANGMLRWADLYTAFCRWCVDQQLEALDVVPCGRELEGL